jgi:hypothetical protein
MQAAMRATVAGLLAVMLVACSSGLSAQDWAGTVCSALTPWRTQITDLNARAASQMAAATTPEQTRDSLVALLEGGRDASETARLAVETAGVPDVEGGAAVAQSFVAALAGARDAYAQARAELLALPMDDEDAFYDGVVAVMARLDEQYRASAVDTTGLSSPELRTAFDGIAECR